MRRVLSLLIALSFSFTLLAIPSAAVDTSGICGENLTWLFSEDTGTLTISGTGNMQDFAYGTSPWTELNDAILTVVIGDGVSRIGDFAFNGCKNMTEITISNNVFSIGNCVFQNTSLESVMIPAGVRDIANKAFYLCPKLREIHVAEENPAYSVIDNVLFNKDGSTLVLCPMKKSGSYIIPDGVIFVGNSAFMNCHELLDLSIPASVTEIGVSAFANTGIKAFHVAEDNPNYQVIDGVLYNRSGSELVSCSRSIMSDFIIPNGVTEISPYAFFGFIGITSVTIPDSVNRIGSYAFNGCGGLTSVIIPDSITNIAFGVFGTCSSMKSVTIPDSVTKIESRAFIGCSSLTDVYYAGTIDQWAALDIESNNEDLINATIHFDSTGSESAPEPEPEPRKDQTSFSDVDSSAYYAEAVHWAANHEPLITNGVGDGRFDPAGIVNRAQAVTFLWRAVGCPEPETSVSSFTDVTDPNAYYYKAVLWAAEKNITNGVGDGTFNLTGELSYGHMLTFLWRAITGKTASSYGTWYSEAMDWAKANSLDSGLSIDAIGYCPRGDVVYFLWRQMA